RPEFIGDAGQHSDFRHSRPPASSLPLAPPAAVRLADRPHALGQRGPAAALQLAVPDGLADGRHPLHHRGHRRRLRPGPASRTPLRNRGRRRARWRSASAHGGPVNAPLAICAAIVVGTVAASLAYGQLRGRKPTMAEWAVGGRRFGSWIFWFVNAG